MPTWLAGWPSPLMIDMTTVPLPVPASPLERSGLRPGSSACPAPGAALTGLAEARRGLARASPPVAARCYGTRHGARTALRHCSSPRRRTPLPGETASKQCGEPPTGTLTHSISLDACHRQTDGEGREWSATGWGAELLTELEARAQSPPPPAADLDEGRCSGSFSGPK